MALKKSDILQGINDPKEIRIESLDGTLWLRPLSSSELDEIDKIEAKGMESYETNSKSRGRIQGETIAKGKINVSLASRVIPSSGYCPIILFPSPRYSFFIPLALVSTSSFVLL